MCITCIFVVKETAGTPAKKKATNKKPEKVKEEDLDNSEDSFDDGDDEEGFNDSCDGFDDMEEIPLETTVAKPISKVPTKTHSKAVIIYNLPS